METMVTDMYQRDVPGHPHQLSRMDLTAQVLSQLLAEMDLVRLQSTPQLMHEAATPIHAPASRPIPPPLSPISTNGSYRSSGTPPRYARTPTELMKLLNRRPASTHRLAPLVIDVESEPEGNPEVAAGVNVPDTDTLPPAEDAVPESEAESPSSPSAVFDILELYAWRGEADIDKELDEPSPSPQTPAPIRTVLPAPIPIRRAMHAELAVRPRPLPLPLPRQPPLPLAIPPLPPLPLQLQMQSTRNRHQRTRSNPNSGNPNAVPARVRAQGLQRSSSQVRNPGTGDGGTSQRRASLIRAPAALQKRTVSVDSESDTAVGSGSA